MIIGLILGLLLGALLMNFIVEEEKNTNELLKKSIINLEESLDLANLKIENRDTLINDYQQEHEILLNNSAELRAKVIDLQNNVELLVNNSKNKKIKELILDYQSQN